MKKNNFPVRRIQLFTIEQNRDIKHIAKTQKRSFNSIIREIVANYISKVINS